MAITFLDEAEPTAYGKPTKIVFLDEEPEIGASEPDPVFAQSEDDIQAALKDSKRVPVQTSLGISGFRRGLEQSRAADALAAGNPEALVAANARRDALPVSPVYERVSQAKTVSDQLSAALEDPLLTMAELTGESTGALLPQMLQKAPPAIMAGVSSGAALGSAIPGAGTLAGAGVGLTAGVAAATGLSSLELEYSGKFQEVLSDNGVDLKNADSIRSAFGNPELMANARSAGLKKGLPIAAFDALSAGVAGRLFSKPAATALGKAGQLATELGAQAGLGMAGELSGQLVAGEEINAPSILLEGLGELGPGVGEVAVGRIARNFKAQGKSNVADRIRKVQDELAAIKADVSDLPRTAQVLREDAPITNEEPIYAESVVPDNAATQPVQPEPQEQGIPAGQDAGSQEGSDTAVSEGAGTADPAQGAEVVEGSGVEQPQVIDPASADQAALEQRPTNQSVSPETPVLLDGETTTESEIDQDGQSGNETDFVTRSVVVRSRRGSEYEETDSKITRDDSVYRGMTEAEYMATIGKSGYVQSRGDFRFAGEGTNFAEKFSEAEDYVNVGRDDPRVTGKPTYIVEVNKNESISANRRGEYESTAPQKPARVWRVTAEGENLVATEITNEQNPTQTEGQGQAEANKAADSQGATQEDGTGEGVIAPKDGSIAYYAIRISRDEVKEGQGMGLMSMLRNESSETISEVIRIADANISAKSDVKEWRNVKEKAERALKQAKEREASRAAEEARFNKEREAQAEETQKQVAYEESVAATPIPKGKKVKMSITLTDGGKEQVDVTDYNGVSVRKVPVHKGHTYTVSHTASGLAIERSIKTVSAAKRLVQMILHTGVDMTQSAIQSDDIKRLTGPVSYYRTGKNPPYVAQSTPTSTVNEPSLPSKESVTNEPTPPSAKEPVVASDPKGDAGAQAVPDTERVKTPDEDVPPQVPDDESTPPPIPDNEPAQADAGGEPTALANDVANKERKAAGKEPFEKGKTVGDQELIDRAKEALAKTNVAGEALVNDILEKDTTIDDEQAAILLVHKRDIQNMMADAFRVANDESATPAQREAASQLWTELDGKLDAVLQAANRAGSKQGRALRFRRVLMAQDFSKDGLLERARMKKGSSLSENEVNAIDALAARAEKLNKELSELQAAQEEKDRFLAIEQTLSELREETKREAKRKAFQERLSKIDPAILAIAERINAKADRMISDGLAEWRKAMRRTNTGVDPTMLVPLVKTGTGLVLKGIAKVAVWRPRMIEMFGAEAEPYLDEVYKQSVEQADQTGEKIVSGEPAKVREKVARATGGKGRVKPTPQQKAENITERIKARLADGDDITSLHRFIKSLAKQYVAMGINKVDPLVTAVQGELEEIVPGIERRTVMDAISGYGDFKPLNKGEIEATLRDLKGQMRALAKIEDLQNKQPLKKSGPERATPSDEERRLNKLVEEYKKKYGVTVTDSESQLRSALSAVKARLRNQITDLDYAIANREPIANQNTPVQYDEEAKGLLERRNKLKEQYDAIFPKEGMPQEKQLALIDKALERQIAELEGDMKSGRLYPEKKESRRLTSPEIEAKRKRLESLREERSVLRALDTATVEQRKAEAIQKRIAELEQVIANGVPETANSGQPTADTEQLAGLKEKRDTLQRVIDKAKRERNNPAKSEQEKQLASLDKQIAALKEKIANGDTSTRPKKATVDTEAVSKAKQERDALNKELSGMRRGPIPTKDDIALKSFKSRAKRLIADYQERMANGDFERHTRKPVEPDAEAVKLKHELAKTKQEFERMQSEWIKSRRSSLKKAGEFMLSMIGLHRSVFLGGDHGTVLRQAGRLTKAHPIWAAKSAKSAGVAARSDFGAFKEHNAIEEREFSPLYDKGKTKLAIMNPQEESFYKGEEMIVGDWARKVPVVNNLNRGQVAYLNRMRAEMFDMMVRWMGGPANISEARASIIADAANLFTGRGSLYGMERSAKAWAEILLAPRYWSSRIQLVTGMPILKALRYGEGRLAAIIAKEYLQTWAGTLIWQAMFASAMAALYPQLDMDDDLKNNPFSKEILSSDFGKVRMNNTRLDFTDGSAKHATFIARMLTGKSMSKSGEVYDLRGEDARQGAMAQMVGRYMRSSLGIVPGAALDILTGEDIMGRKVTPEEVVMARISPLIASQVDKVLGDLPTIPAMFANVFGFFGAGVNTYEDDSSDFKEKYR